MGLLFSGEVWARATEGIEEGRYSVLSNEQIYRPIIDLILLRMLDPEERRQYGAKEQTRGRERVHLVLNHEPYLPDGTALPAPLLTKETRRLHFPPPRQPRAILSMKDLGIYNLYIKGSSFTRKRDVVRDQVRGRAAVRLHIKVP